LKDRLKTKLGNSETKSSVETLVNEKLGEFLEENPSVGKKIIEKCVRAAKQEKAARKARGFNKTKECPRYFQLPVNLLIAPLLILTLRTIHC
jgi:DNA gyrase subunit B